MSAARRLLPLTAAALLASACGGVAKSPEQQRLEQQRQAEERYAAAIAGVEVPVLFVTRSKTGGFGGEWYGQMHLADWDQVRNGNPSVRFIQFTRCSYLNDRGERIANAATKGPNGVDLGYADTMVVSVDALFRVMPQFTVDYSGEKLDVRRSDAQAPAPAAGGAVPASPQ